MSITCFDVHYCHGIPEKIICVGAQPTKATAQSHCSSLSRVPIYQQGMDVVAGTALFLNRTRDTNDKPDEKSASTL